MWVSIHWLDGLRVSVRARVNMVGLGLGSLFILIVGAALTW